MIESRIPAAGPILAALATLALSGCGESADPLPDKVQTKREQAALVAAERRITALHEEQTRDRRRLAELTTSAGRLEQRNRELEQHLARARHQLARATRAERTLRQQRDQYIRRVRELDNERRALHANLARANHEIRRLQSRQPPDQRRTAGPGYRGAAAAREIEELRRYNGFLLQERGNLQAWLEEANATRRKQLDALRKAEQDIARIESASATSVSAGKKLRMELDRTLQELSTVKRSRDALADEIEPLRAAATRVSESERDRSEYLEKALAHASSPAEAHGAVAPGIDSGADASIGVAALRAELDEARSKVSRLQSAKDYLVEKIEACTARQQSSISEPMQLALMGSLLQGRSEAVASPPARGRFMTAQWQAGSIAGVFGRSELIAVATGSDDASKSTRHEKELKAARQELKELQQEHETLTKEMEQMEAECATVREQVQTLTWANKELVKELDAAYQTHEAGIPGRLPDGTRGVYVLREGESLSLVAKAFYGEAARWQDIVEANKEKIPDPDRVKAGTIILIPE
jgi:nucleoid-associated protein YgaU